MKSGCTEFSTDRRASHLRRRLILRYPLPYYARSDDSIGEAFASSTAMSSPSVVRRLAIPVASLVPTAAIIFAFALGPSPEKYVADFCAHEGTPEARRVWLEKAGPRAVAALVRRIVGTSTCHQDEVLDFLGRVRAKSAMEALRRIASSPTEAPEIRARAAAAAAALAKENGGPQSGLSSVGSP